MRIVSIKFDPAQKRQPLQESRRKRGTLQSGKCDLMILLTDFYISISDFCLET
jgi:hypothetical protein